MKGLFLRNGILWMRYTINGRQFRESTGTKDRRAAELVLTKRKLEIHEGKWFDKKKETRTSLHKTIPEYLNAIKERKVSWEDDKVMLDRFAEFMGPDAILEDIDRRTIEKFQTFLLSNKLSKARTNRYVACLKAFFYRCIEWGMLQKNPVRGVKMFHEGMRIKYLELGQIRSLLHACSDRLRPIITAALLTGLRQGDILKLRWADVDFENRKIHILQGKTKHPLVINMSETFVDVLKGIAVNPDCPYVFQEGGKGLTAFGWLRGDFALALKAAGISDFRFHDLRHTVATQQRFLGRDIGAIKELLGHRSTKMTERYAHIRPSELKEANDALGEKIMGKKLAQNKHNDDFVVHLHGAVPTMNRL